MGLYLTIFDEDDELDGVQVGHYSNFVRLQDAVAALEGSERGSRFAWLTLHSDCDGEWSTQECAAILAGLTEIRAALSSAPPTALEGWQVETARQLRIQPKNLLETFFDVDGEPLLDGLERLARRAIEADRPILFQ